MYPVYPVGPTIPKNTPEGPVVTTDPVDVETIVTPPIVFDTQDKLVE